MNKTSAYFLISLFMAFSYQTNSKSSEKILNSEKNIEKMVLKGNLLEERVKNLTNTIEEKKSQFSILMNGKVSNYLEFPTNNFFLYYSSDNNNYLAIIKNGNNGYAAIDINPDKDPGIDIYYKRLEIKDDETARKIIKNTIEKKYSKNKNIIIFNEMNIEEMKKLYSKILDKVEEEF